MAGHRRANWVRVQVRVRVVLRIFRRSVAVEDPSVSDSALRHRQARVHTSVVSQNSDHNLRFASQSRRRLPARLLVKRAAREKEGKAPMVNLVARHQEVERPLQASQPEVEHLPRQASAARNSHNTERSNQRKERRRLGHNNSGSIICSGSGKENFRSRFFCESADRCSGSCVSCNSIKFAGDTPASTAILRSAPRSTQRL